MNRRRTKMDENDATSRDAKFCVSTLRLNAYPCTYTLGTRVLILVNIS